MTQDQLRAELRELIGNPNVTTVNAKQLDSHLIAALEYAASELDFNIVTDANVIGFVADQSEYPLPKSFAKMVWVESDSVRLTATSTYKLEKEGTNYRTSASGTPQNYAIEAGILIFNPPPSSDYITDTASPVIRYIASQNDLPADGVFGLSDLDEQVVLYKAAIRYLRSHPSDENQARIAGYQEELRELIRSAKRRALNPDETFSPNFFVDSQRNGAAR